MDKAPLNWEVTSNDDSIVVAKNRKTGEIFAGTLTAFNLLLSGEKQQFQYEDDPNLLVVSDEIFHVVGTAATLLERPTGKTILCMVVDTGSFRYRVGDYVAAGMPATADPTASVTNGVGALKIPEWQSVVVSAPAKATVKGYSAADVLTYWWL